MNNPVGLLGLEFLEFATPDPKPMHDLFLKLGFAPLTQVPKRAITLYGQNSVRWILNSEPSGFAHRFSKEHGPSIPAMGWRVKNAAKAFHEAVDRGAEPCEEGDYRNAKGKPVPAVYGVGDSLIYFVEGETEGIYRELGFAAPYGATAPKSSAGLLAVDHLTNNVPNGFMEQWALFYKEVFGFTEVRYFDIKGKKTGLTSFALRSPDGSFCIPINEAQEEKSQINEYLREYRGAGIQHVALLTEDIVETLGELNKNAISMLSVEDAYYDTVFDRVPNVVEDRETLKKLGVLVDGDEKGYLLQIFTKNLIGPIFFEFIQRKNHLSFGEGNFGALFRSVERDQEERGVL